MHTLVAPEGGRGATVFYTPSASVLSTASVRFHGTGGGMAVDRIKVPVDPPAPADVGAGDFTVEFWMKGTLADNVTPSAGYRANGVTEVAAIDWIYGNIIVDRDIFGAGPDWGMSIHRDGPLADRGVLRFGTENRPPDLTPHTLQGRRQVLDGVWHHVAFVRERGSGIKRIYVDGGLDVASAAGVSTGDLSYPDGRDTTLPDSDPFLVFGAEKHGFEGTSIYPSFNGWMDEIRVWSVARSGAEIEAARVQSVAPTTPGLALYLPLEEGSGTALVDATGGNVATLFAGVPGNGEWSTDTPLVTAPTTTSTSTSTTSTSTTTAPPTTSSTTSTSTSSSSTTSSSSSSTTTAPPTTSSTTSTSTTSTSSTTSSSSSTTTAPPTTSSTTSTSTTSTSSTTSSS